MGGAPSISGGMSQAEYQQLLMEQRKYAEEADLKREQKLKEYETQRLQAEKDLINAQKIAEQEMISSQQAAEQQISEEIQASDQAEQTRADTLNQSFYDSLYRGLYGQGEQPRPR